MNQALSDDLLSRFQSLLADQMGLHFGPERWPDLRRGLEAASRDFGYRDAGDCLAWLAAAPFSHRQIEVLANHLTIGETYFFRERRSWEILETEVLPDLVRSRRQRDRRLRLWSAGCATGEEAYSLAILLTRTIADWRDWAITLLATDVNTSSLERALEGVYGEWSFRDAPPWLKDGYFRQVGNSRYRLESWIRQLVTFAPLNLASDQYPSLLNNTNAMDLIVCRNVVMYFSPAQAQRVLSQMQHCLVGGGWLVGTATESTYLAAIGLTPVRFPGGVLYRKVETQGDAPIVRVPSAERSETSGLAEAAAARPTVRCAPDNRSTNAPAIVERAVAHQQQGRCGQAAADLQKLLAGDPDNAALLELLTRVYADQGKLTEALGWSEKAVAADKLNPHRHFLHAAILQELGAHDQALSSLNRALYLEHDFVAAHFALGSLARRLGRHGLAKRHFSAALRLLDACASDAIVPASEGLTAGRLREMIVAMASPESNA